MSDSVTLWTIAHQSPLSMGFSGREYWSELLCPPPGDLLNPRIISKSLMSPAWADGFFTMSGTWEAQPLPLSSSEKFSSPQRETPYPFSIYLHSLSLSECYIAARAEKLFYISQTSSQLRFMCELMCLHTIWNPELKSTRCCCCRVCRGSVCGSATVIAGWL